SHVPSQQPLPASLHGWTQASRVANSDDSLLQRSGAAPLEYLSLPVSHVDRGDPQVAFGVPLRAPEPRADHLPARLRALCALGEGEGAAGAAGGSDVAANWGGPAQAQHPQRAEPPG